MHPMGVRFSWLENAVHMLIVFGIFSSKVGHIDLIFGVPSGFISRSVCTRKITSLCVHCAAVMICATMLTSGRRRTDSNDPLI